MTWLSESPTSTQSTPASSTRRPKSASYAVTATIFRPSRFQARKSLVVTLGSADGDDDMQLLELALPERAVRQLRVGDDEVGLAHVPLAEQDDVAIQCARTPAHVA